jgi:hypothetical protein
LAMVVVVGTVAEGLCVTVGCDWAGICGAACGGFGRGAGGGFGRVACGGSGSVVTTGASAPESTGWPAWGRREVERLITCAWPVARPVRS